MITRSQREAVIQCELIDLQGHRINFIAKGVGAPSLLARKLAAGFRHVTPAGKDT